MSITLAEVAALVDGRVVGDPELRVSGLGSLDTACPGQISHLSSAAYRVHLSETGATAVLLRDDDVAACPVAAVVVSNPYLAFALVSQRFENVPAPRSGVDPSASVAPDVVLGSRVSVGGGARIAAGARLGDDVVVFPNAVIGAGCVLGNRARVYPNATLYHGVTVGADSIIHAGAVIGADGFGFAPDTAGRFEPIAQLGGVILGERVSVGAATTIDRGAIDDTVIGDGVKIDNQCQIGHNCRIGDDTLICGCVGIVGSTTIGRHCVLAGGVGVGGDRPITICDGVTVTGKTHISQSIDTPGVYSSSSLQMEHAQWKRNAIRFRGLDALARRLRTLEKALDQVLHGSVPGWPGRDQDEPDETKLDRKLDRKTNADKPVKERKRRAG